MFGCRIDFDGGASLNHFIGTASVCASVGLPGSYVAFGLVHNVYRAGDFRDGRAYGADPARRRLVRSAVGSEVESFAYERFVEPRLTVDTPIPDADRHAGRMELADLCELYEKFEDGRIHAANPDRADLAAVARHGDALIERARALAGDDFADQLADALRRPADLPVGARSGTTYGWQQIPSHTTVRPTVTARRAVEHATSATDRTRWWTRRQLRRAGRLVRRVAA